MMHATFDIVSALQFLIKESFADKRRAGEVFRVGDRFKIIEGPYAGITAEAIKIKNLHGSPYLYARDVNTGQNLTYPICFARQIQSLNP